MYFSSDSDDNQSHVFSESGRIERQKKPRCLPLTVPGAVVPLASLIPGHVELRAQADALLLGRLEEQDRQFPNAAPLAADQLRRVETNLLYVVSLRT